MDTKVNAGLVLALVSFVSLVVIQLPTYIFAVDPSELPQQLLRSLIEQQREHQPYLDHQIAAAAVARRRHATLVEPKPLPRLRARRHAQAYRTVR